MFIDIEPSAQHGTASFQYGLSNMFPVEDKKQNGFHLNMYACDVCNLPTFFSC